MRACFFFHHASFKILIFTYFLQVRDPSLPDSSGDGLHSGADGVQQVGQLTGAVGLPALLQHKPGEGQNVGVEGSFVGHLAVRRGTGTLCLKWKQVSGDLKLKSELQSRDRGEETGGCGACRANQKCPSSWLGAGSITSLAVGLKSKVQR